MAYYLPSHNRTRNEGAESPFWISYADLMTALVMLFLVVMSISMVAIASRSMVEKQLREQDIAEVLDHFDQRAKNTGLEMTVNRNTHTISFGEQALFPLNSYRLTTSAQTTLQRFVPIMLAVQKGEKGGKWLKRVHVEGYTDESGTYLYNVNLSLNRAQAVVCAMFAGKLSVEQQVRLRQLLMIDGATVTSIKETRDESRRVEVRLEFRKLGDDEINRPVPYMAMGACAIPIQG
jgi:outer membrane protein OmpA-like peptidoglycan-associated protein